MNNADERHDGARKLVSRRLLMTGAGALGLSVPGSLIAGRVLALSGAGLPPDMLDGVICRAAVAGPAAASPATETPAAAVGPLKKVRFAWNATAACLPTVTVAQEKGFFAKHGLDVELVNYSGSTDQLLETLATGKADAAVGMALRWLKPLEQGFDVKIVAGLHGGCMRLLAPASSGIKELKDLKGKSIAVNDTNAPDKNFFSILLKKAGLDPYKDVDFKYYPQPLLRAAVEKGEADALSGGDPFTYMWLKDKKFVQVSSNLDGEYSDRTCCIVGISGRLIRDDRATAKAITDAIYEAADYTAHHPEEAAATLSPYVTNVSVGELAELAHYHTHHQHPAGQDLKQQLTLYAEDLKLVSVLKPSTDPTRYAERIFADLLS